LLAKCRQVFSEIRPVGRKTLRRLIGIGAAVARRPLPHHRAYGSIHGGSGRLPATTMLRRVAVKRDVGSGNSDQVGGLILNPLTSPRQGSRAASAPTV